MELKLKNIRTVEDLGAASFSSLEKGSLIPHSAKYAVDVWKSTEVNIVERGTGVQVCGGSFADEHPQEWTSSLATEGRIAVVVTRRNLSSYKDWSALHAEGHIVLMSLAVRGGEGGVGIVPPPV